MYEMIRTFNSVGQGAFYTEEFYNSSKGDYFTMVYDCGSYGNQALIENEIKHSGIKKYIDLLCISHFHADHINGLEYLLDNYNVKKILLPFLHEEEKIEVFLANVIREASSFIQRLSLDPQATIRERSPVTQVITVNSNDNNEPNNNNEPTHVNELEENISSGQPIKIDNDSTWIYVPFNFNYSTRSVELKKALASKSIDIKDFENIYKTRENDIIDIYKSITGDLNTNSLVIYSGHMDNKKSGCHTEFLKPYYYHYFHRHRECGCIYMGDYNAKGVRKWNEFEKAFNSYFDDIGIIQIPHHGSRHNYNSKLNFKPYLFSIMSAGIKNSFRHPHGSTLKQIILHDGIPIIVTENPHSKFIQKIDIC